MARPNRNYRIDDDDYEAAGLRAAEDGVTISEAARRLVTAYGRRLLDLPRRGKEPLYVNDDPDDELS